MIHGRRAPTGGLGGEEIDRLGRGDRLAVLLLELEQQHALDQLLLELRIAALGRHDLAERDVPVGRDREAQHDLALQRRIVAQSSIVDRVDRAFVAVERALDLLPATRRLVAVAAALRRAADGLEPFDRVLHLRGRAAREAVAAGVAGERSGVDAPARVSDARRDLRALGERRVRGAAADEVLAVELLGHLVVAQRRKLIGERQQTGDLGLLARLLRRVDGLRRLGLRLLDRLLYGLLLRNFLRSEERRVGKEF